MIENESNELRPAHYDQRWLDSAWGTVATRDLLEGKLADPRPRVARALELAQIQPGLRVLDIACGRGEVPAMASLAGAHAVGLDFSETSLEVAWELRQASRSEQGSMELVRADACTLPFPDACFDRVTMLDIVEHLTPGQLERMFREVARVLNPGGFAVVHTLPNRWVYDITFPLLHRLKPSIPCDPRGLYDRVVHINEQDLPALHRMLNACGLRHTLWLEQLMPAQARWNAGRDRYGDNRDNLYPLLAGPIGRVMELLSFTPLKLLLSNDIFGLLWKGPRPAAMLRPRLSLTERVACLVVSPQKQPEAGRPPSESKHQNAQTKVRGKHSVLGNPERTKQQDAGYFHCAQAVKADWQIGNQ